MEYAPGSGIPAVLILKADRLYAAALRQLAQRAFLRVNVTTVASVKEASLALAAQVFDVFVADADSSLEGDVLDLLLRDADRSPRAHHMLVLTAPREYRVLATLRTLRVGGVFDSSGEAPERFILALQTVASGGHYWSATMREDAQPASATSPELSRRLTIFEQVVLSIIGDGRDDMAAAQELGLKPATICTVRRDLHRKLGVQHRGELVRMAAQHGFVRFTPAGVMRPGYAQLAAAYEARKTKRSDSALTVMTPVCA